MIDMIRHNNDIHLNKMKRLKVKVTLAFNVQLKSDLSGNEWIKG